MSTADLGIVHMDMARLDLLSSLAGELVPMFRTFVDQARRARVRYGFKEPVLDLLENTERVGRITEEIQSRIIKARLVPVGSLFRRFEGLVEDLPVSGDKEMRLSILGERTEVDKRTIDELVEPLVHLVRNAMDHGIEGVERRERAGKPRAGTITLEALQEGDRFVVEVRDDGAGIDEATVRASAVERGFLSEEACQRLDDKATLELLFHPGLSTSEQVTGMSGRGLGLDVAKRRVEMLGGTLELSTVPGKGTRARIEVPLTAVIVNALIVVVGDEKYSLPIEHVREIVRARASEITTVEERESIDLRGEPLSLVHLADLIELPSSERREDPLRIVVVSSGGREVGLVVHRILEQHEIVVKGMGRRLAAIEGIAGASIGGDGNVVMVLDVARLCRESIDAIEPG